MTPLDHLTVRKRLPAWLRHYPSAAFWEPWHMALLAHGGSGAAPPSASRMADLYHPAKPQINPASSLLLTFEKRTRFGALPGQMRMDRTAPQSLLLECVGSPVSTLARFWGTLDDHAAKHLTPVEVPHLDAAARAIRSEVKQRGVNPDGIPGFFPSSVSDVVTYAALARAILYLGMLADSPLHARLYWAQGHSWPPYHALSLNFDVPQGFLAQHGQLTTREIVLGLQVAIGETVTVGQQNVHVPVMGRQVSFSTLFAPDQGMSSRVRTVGRSADVTLQ